MGIDTVQKNKRQEKILELLSQYDIETQDELIEKLSLEGFSVTQATVSRDIREMQVIKVSDSKGKYKYAPPSAVLQRENGESSNFAEKLGKSLADSVISAECAGNIVVIKTSPGLAPAVATGIDTLSADSILGCVAGDDCIIAVARNAEYAAEICADIMKIL
ncbi:MAG: arginine repressor [Firmicutes bacterium]|nr:arginine repressor [Bacillota bacterium]